MKKSEVVLDKDMSYIYGWFLADGTLYNTTRNRGRLSTEVSSKDLDILEKMSYVLTREGFKNSITSRTRNTNFKSNYESKILRICSLELRTFFKECGFPEGKKSCVAKPPSFQYDEVSFSRGYIDADGSFSIGKTHDIPILSICLSSDFMYEFFREKLKIICGFESNIKRNSRDNVYNLMITRKKALLFIKWLGYEEDGILSLNRKRMKAVELLSKYNEKYFLGD